MRIGPGALPKTDRVSQLHSPGSISDWKRLLTPLLGEAITPFYLFSATPLAEALKELDRAFGGLPITHWLSAKTQPLPALFRWWREQGRPIEVVSELEFLAARACGFAPDQILVNGPAKHRWLPQHPLPGLTVNFDSVAEIRALAVQAKRLNWQVGLRLNTPSEFDPEKPEYPTQFGLAETALGEALSLVRQAGLEPMVLHLHLRTNISQASVYNLAFREALSQAAAAGWQPSILDVGGGFPPPAVRTKGGDALDAQFCLREMADVYRRILEEHPHLQQLWLENGRWGSARSGVLVVRVLDAKEHRGKRNLICDGGRTMNALVSLWESHELFTLPDRTGEEVITTVNGPTCMAFDKLVRRRLPRSLTVGDHIVWMDAGAYHLPWETRFSHGLAGVYWHDGQTTDLVRKPDSFANWWNQWTT